MLYALMHNIFFFHALCVITNSSNDIHCKSIAYSTFLSVNVYNLVHLMPILSVIVIRMEIIAYITPKEVQGNLLLLLLWLLFILRAGRI